MQNFLANLFQTQTRICCFHFGRCGSTLLGNMVASHPRVEWHSELLHEFHKNGNQEDDPWNLILDPMHACQTNVFGFETKFQHLNHRGLDISFSDFVERLQEFKFSKFIVLRRENYLRQAISVVRGQRTNKWHYRATDPTPSSFKGRLNTDRVQLGGKPRPMLECFQWLDEQYKAAEAILNPLDYLKLSYEDDLLSDPSVGLRKLTDFAGIHFHRPEADLQRINNQPISKILENHEDVSDVLKATPFEWMLN